MFTVSIHEPMIDTIILFDGGYHEVSYGRDGWKYYDTTLCWMTDFPLFNRVYLFGLGCKPNLLFPEIRVIVPSASATGITTQAPPPVAIPIVFTFWEFFSILGTKFAQEKLQGEVRQNNR